MRCPTCGQNTPDSWVSLVSADSGKPELETPARHRVTLAWMRCANDECKQLVIRADDTYTRRVQGYPRPRTDTWLVHPRHNVRPVDPLVPEDMARDFQEAAAILDRSHRMSAVLARRILADLLERYAGLPQFSLTARIDKFIADTSQPRALRENLHYLREIADFAAHTQTNDESEVIDASREEAEWTLDVVERLFDHFIVAPAKDEEVREGMDAKLKEAGRKEIKPLPPDP